MKFDRRALYTVLLMLAPAALDAATHYVENNGLDSSTCGTSTDPCRSLGQAIANASSGDTIIVGPGQYGDLSDSGSFMQPGEEQGAPACGGIRGVICIDRPLIIESSHGAKGTFLQSVLGVRLLVDGITFGGPSKGFSMYMRDFLYFEPGTAENKVIGNTIHRSGADIQGSGHTFAQNIIAVDGRLSIDGTSQTVRDNVMYGNCAGVDIAGSGHSFTNNLISGCSHGLVLSGSDILIEGNSFLASVTGVRMGENERIAFSGNNIFSNAVGADPDCGFINASGAAFDATNNFWGSPLGPGPDPADEVCDEDGAVTTTAPFATQPFAVRSEGGGSAGNGGPVCTAAQAAPTMLWPANGQFVSASITGIGDPEGDVVSITISGVTQDEPTSGLTNGDTGPDAIISPSGVTLRSQRDAGGNGRVYRIEFTANDGNGGSCSGSVTVGVPNSLKPGLAVVDDGQSFDSTQP